MNKLALSEKILMNIEKPARYIGNEVPKEQLETSIKILEDLNS